MSAELHAEAMNAVEVPNSWLVIGLIPITIRVLRGAILRLPHRRRWADCSGGFICGVAGVLPRDQQQHAPIGAIGKVKPVYAVLPVREASPPPISWLYFKLIPRTGDSSYQPGLIYFARHQ